MPFPRGSSILPIVNDVHMRSLLRQLSSSLDLHIEGPPLSVHTTTGQFSQHFHQDPFSCVLGVRRHFSGSLDSVFWAYAYIFICMVA